MDTNADKYEMSGLAALFRGLCELWDIRVNPVFDLNTFALPGHELHVVVSSREGDAVGPLMLLKRFAHYETWKTVVLERQHLDVLRVMAQGTQAVAYLEDLAGRAA